MGEYRYAAGFMNPFGYGFTSGYMAPGGGRPFRRQRRHDCRDAISKGIRSCLDPVGDAGCGIQGGEMAEQIRDDFIGTDLFARDGNQFGIIFFQRFRRVARTLLGIVVGQGEKIVTGRPAALRRLFRLDAAVGTTAVEVQVAAERPQRKQIRLQYVEREAGELPGDGAVAVELFDQNAAFQLRVVELQRHGQAVTLAFERQRQETIAEPAAQVMFRLIRVVKILPVPANPQRFGRFRQNARREFDGQLSGAAGAEHPGISIEIPVRRRRIAGNGCGNRRQYRPSQ